MLPETDRASLLLAKDAQLAGGDVEDDAVDGDTTLGDGLLDGVVAADGLQALADVELGKAQGLHVDGLDGVDLALVLAAQVAQGLQPGVESGAQVVVVEGVDGAAALGVAAQHDALDLDGADGEVDDGLAAQVAGLDDIGDVAVDEDVAGLAVADGRLGHARVAAAKPQHLGLLALRQRRPQLRLALGGAAGVALVARDDALEGICRNRTILMSAHLFRIVSRGPGPMGALPAPVASMAGSENSECRGRAAETGARCAAEEMQRTSDRLCFLMGVGGGGRFCAYLVLLRQPPFFRCWFSGR